MSSCYDIPIKRRWVEGNKLKILMKTNQKMPFILFFFLAAVIGSHFVKLPQWRICTNNCIFTFYNFGCANSVVIAYEFNDLITWGIILHRTGIEPTFQWRQILNHWATREVPRITFVKALKSDLFIYCKTFSKVYCQLRWFPIFHLLNLNNFVRGY